MSKKDVNRLPVLIREGALTEKQALNELAEFICTEPVLFGLHRYDEDFRSEVILCFLEKGHAMIRSFDSRFGQFFSYFFSYVTGIICSLRRVEARTSMQNSVKIDECIKNWPDKISAYRRTNFSRMNLPVLPFAYRNIPADKLREALMAGETKQVYVQAETEAVRKIPKKALLVLALKSSYYITDEQIKSISGICGVDSAALESAVQLLRDSLHGRAEKRQLLEEKRNRAYFYRQHYVKQLQLSDPDDGPQLKLMRKLDIQTVKWNSINTKLSSAGSSIKPTNKAVAEVIGISERQVAYYIRYLKENGQLSS